MSVSAITQERGKKVLVSVNPADLSEIGRVDLMTEDQIRAAIESAQKASPSWGALSLKERGEYLLAARDYMSANFDEIAETICKEMGKPRTEAANAELLTVLDLISYYVKKAPQILKEESIPIHLLPLIKKSKLVYEPLGIVAVVSPWNYPFAIPMSGIVFALLTGNTVLFKPASDVTFVGLKIKEIFDRGAELPEGVFNLILAEGRTVGSILFRPPVKKVVFTGSTEIGKWIMEECGKHLIPTVLELGGKDPMVVLEDADIELAAKGAVWGAFTNCGQVCASIERCYVHESIADKFMEKVKEEVSKLRIGPYTQDDVDMGPMVSAGQLRIVEEHVQDAVSRGAKVIHGGKKREDLKGYFYEPTVLANVNHDMRCIREETFGPTLPIMTFKDEAEAIRLANDSNFGLTASVWTSDKKRGEEIAKRIEAGTVCVNDHAYTYGVCDTPWQGVKESGVGRSHSKLGLLEFVFPKHLNIDNSLPGMKRRLWWYPYSGAAYNIQKWVAQFVGGRGITGKLKPLAALLKKLFADKGYRDAVKMR